MDTQVKRIPRPMGLTALMHQYHSTGDEATFAKAKDYLINQWSIGNGAICGTMYDINQFSYVFNLDINEIRIHMRDKVLNSKIWDKDKQEELLTGLLGEQLCWAIEDRMEIAQQVQLLRTSQGGKYTPYVSSELNRALKLKLESSTSLQSIVRSMMGGPTTNIFNQFNQQNISNGVESQFISIEEARELIQSEQKTLDSTAEVKYIESKYDPTAWPEVVAIKQEGVDISKEGVGTLDQAELTLITDNYQESMKASSQDHHTMRREIEMNIDPNEPDPEFEYQDIPDFTEDQLDSITDYYLRH